MPNEDTKLEVLHDHYKDSFAYCQEHRKQRDRFLVYILLALTLLLFQTFSPTTAEASIGEFISEKLGITTPIDTSFIGSVIWFALLSFVLRYFQSCITLERQYKYVHKLEEHLCEIYKGEVFSREGKSYLSEYPKFSDWAHIVYTWFFPMLLIVTVGGKIISEIYLAKFASLPLILNAIFAIFIVISSVIYLRDIHPRIKPNRRKK